jgi:hypothetical protein
LNSFFGNTLADECQEVDAFLTKVLGTPFGRTLRITQSSPVAEVVFAVIMAEPYTVQGVEIHLMAGV